MPKDYGSAIRAVTSYLLAKKDLKIAGPSDIGAKVRWRISTSGPTVGPRVLEIVESVFAAIGNDPRYHSDEDWVAHMFEAGDAVPSPGQDHESNLERLRSMPVGCILTIHDLKGFSTQRQATKDDN